MACQTSVVIITLNEENNLPECLKTLTWCDDIIVFDSLSTDRTREIAEQWGARVFTRPFDNYASQRNAALAEVEYKHQWVFMLDADERFTPELVEEIGKVLADTSEKVTLFRLRRKDMFMDRWIKGSSGYPSWFSRLIRLGKTRYYREVHEDCITKGQVKTLSEHLIHYPFSKGLTDWFEKHNRYSSMEAELRMKVFKERTRLIDLLAEDTNVRRKALKRIFYGLPLRPWITFIYLFVFRMGVLEGREGFIYSYLRAVYEYMIDLKIKELKRRAKGLAV